MAIATLVVRIAADIADFEKNIAGVERSLQRTGRNLESIGSRLTRGLTLPIVGAVGVVSKAAIDFESSFAGIVKTVSDATDSMGNLTPVGKELAQGMRDLAKTIPVNVNELNRIGEAAGQLGIKSSQIIQFTDVMAKLGITTNLSAEEAATSLARFANIMDRTAVSAGTFSFDRLGATIVDLGNNFATTEAEIVDFGLRIAGAGKIAGLTESQVLAIGAAMSSVGVQAEAGGTAVQKVLNQMTEAVATNNKQLAVFAATAGQSARDFADAFRQDAGQAFAAFVQGLGQQGDAAFQTLDTLKLGNERVIRAFLSLANAGDLVTDTLRVGTQAWEDNIALQKEADQRIRTTKSQLILLTAELQDFAITLGQALMPVINDFIRSARPLVDSLAAMARGFGELPQGVRNAAFAFLGLLAALGPVNFIISQVIQAGAGLIAGFRLIIPAVDKAAIAAGNAGAVFSGLLGTLIRFAGPIAAVVAAVVSINHVMDAFAVSTENGALAIAGIIPSVGLLHRGLETLGATFPRLQGVFEDIVSIVKNSWILAFQEAGRALDILRDAVERTITVVAQSFKPILDAVVPALERLGTVVQNVVVPAIKAAAIAFIASLPPIQSFLLLLSQVPGFSEIESALDRVAKKMEAMVNEANASADAVRSLGVVFTGGMDSADRWSTTLDTARGNVLAASTAMTTFGSSVTRDVVVPLKIGGGEVDAFGKKVQGLLDQITGKELVQSARAWAQALKAPGAAVKVLANDGLRRDLLRVLDDAVEHFGSLEAAGVGGLRRIHQEVFALETAAQRIENIPINFEVRGLDTLGTGFSLGTFSDVIPQIPRSSLSAPLIASLQSAFATIDFESVGARAAIDRVKRGIQEAVVSDDTDIWTKYFQSGLSRALADAERMLGGIAGQMAGLARVTLDGFGRMAEAAKNFGKGVAASTASVIDMGLTIFSIMQQAIAFLERDNLTARTVRDFELAAGGARQLAADAALAGVSLDRLYATDSASAFRREAERITTAIRNQREALDRYNLSWRDFNSTVAQSQVDQITRTLINDFRTLTQQGADPTRVIEGMSDALNQLIVDAVRTGTRIPGALRPMIEAMIRAGRVTEEAAAAILGLEATSMPALADIKEAAERYGLTLDQLGQKVQQISINEQAQQIIADWKLLVDEAGASAETIALAMQESVQDMVTAALTAGLTIPEGMRPILQTMVDMGLLVDENGNKLENLDDISFGRDLTQAIDDLIAKLDELIDAFSTVGTTAEDAWRRARNGAEIVGRAIPRGSFNAIADEAEDAARRIERQFGRIRFAPIEIPFEFQFPEFVGIDPRDFTGTALAAGGVVTRPTLALVGEAGPEAVVPLSQLASYGSIEPESGTTTVIFEADGQVFAEITAPHLPGVVRRYVPA